MLAEKFPQEELSRILISREEWHPFPRATERDDWIQIPSSIRKAHVKAGEALLGKKWPMLPATLFLGYARRGNRSEYEAEHQPRRTALADLVTAECIEFQGRFLDAIADLAWAICEETYWGLPAHVGVQRSGVGLPDVEEPTVDLFAGETAGLLAWTLYLLKPQMEEISPLIPKRIALEIDKRILTPCLEGEDQRWMGFDGHRVNNWNPWCNSNWLTANLLLEPNAERRVAAVSRSLQSLDCFIDPYPKDGGCDEGPSYWGRAGAALFDCLELLHSASGGLIDVFAEPLVGEMGRFIHRAHISEEYVLNFADAPAVLKISPTLAFRFGKRIGDAKMQGMAAEAARRQRTAETGVQEALGRRLPALFSVSELLEDPGEAPLSRDVWLPEIQVMASREIGGSSEGFYLAVKGGHNAESHNHNDVGHFVVYRDGQPVLIDVGVETYRAKTFSKTRYEIWTMQSQYHNLPTVDGVQQQEGVQFAAQDVACRQDDQVAEITLDLAAAYPPEGGIASWTRCVGLKRGQAVEVTDSWKLSPSVKEITFSLMTPCQVKEAGEGSFDLGSRKLVPDRSSGQAVLRVEGQPVEIALEELPLEDPKLQRIWGPNLTRILLRCVSPPNEGQLRIQVL